MWKGGLLASFKLLHADAYDELLGIFVKLGDERLMIKLSPKILMSLYTQRCVDFVSKLRDIIKEDIFLVLSMSL